MEDGRFAGVLGGEEYSLLRLALTYYDELEGCVQTAVREFVLGQSAAEFLAIEGGCGSGITTHQILVADARIRIVAIDNEPKMLEAARVALAQWTDRVKFRNGDLLDTLREMPSAHADIFASGFCIHNLSPAYRAELFPEVGRVLRRGGLFVNVDKVARDDPSAQAADYRTTIARYDALDTIGRSDVKAAWILHYEEDEKVRFTEGEQRDLLAASGFADVRLTKRFWMDCAIVATKS